MFLQHDRLQDIVPADVVRAAQTYFKPSNRTVGYYIPDLLAGSNRRSGRSGSHRDVSQLHEQGVGRSRRIIRSDDCEHREPYRALEAAEWNEGGRSLEEDRQQHGLGNHRPAVWRRDDAGRAARGGVICRRASDVGHEEPHARGDPGRVAKAERAGLRIGWRWRRRWRRTRRTRRRPAAAVCPVRRQPSPLRRRTFRRR